MFIILQKRKLMILLSIVMSIAIIAVFNNVTTTFNDKNKNLCVVVDAGHGGEDGGSEGSLKIPEKEINLKVALFLKDILTKNSVDVIMTRETDTSLHTKGAEKLKQRKRSDLTNRKKIADDSNADMLVSIHMNHFTNSKYKGVQVFYQSGNEKSQQIALAIRDSIAEAIGDENPRQVLKIDEKMIVTQTRIPAVIVECGFLTNPVEEKMLVQEDYQNKLANGIATGILKFQNQV